MRPPESAPLLDCPARDAPPLHPPRDFRSLTRPDSAHSVTASTISPSDLAERMKRVGAVALTALLALAVPATAQAAPEDPLDRFERVDGGQISSDFVPVSADGEAKVTVMVELASDPVAVVDAASTRPLTKAERDSLKAQRKAEQDQLKPALSKLGAQVRSQVQSAYNGIKVSVARKDLPALEALPGVKAVQRVQTHEPTTLTSVPYLGVDRSARRGRRRAPPGSRTQARSAAAAR